MKRKLYAQKLARNLRRQGLSYSEIANRLNVAKSSVSVWCRDIQLSKKQIARLERIRLKAAARGRETMRKMGFSWRKGKYRPTKPDPLAPKVRRLYWEEKLSITEIANKFEVSYEVIYNLMKRNNIPRRSRSESNYATNKYKPQFKIKKNLSVEEEKLRIAGIMLYWAEGSKNGHMIDFTNSDPAMIKLFLEFLRKICGVKDKRLRIYLYAYSYQNIDKLKKYWSKITKVPLEQFTKPYIRKSNPNLSGRKLDNGLVHVRYSDKRLYDSIINWISEYIPKVNFR